MTPKEAAKVAQKLAPATMKAGQGWALTYWKPCKCWSLIEYNNLASSVGPFFGNDSVFIEAHFTRRSTWGGS